MSIRSGDTLQEDRRRFAARPSDILITTPESLFLILTSQARRGALRGVRDGDRGRVPSPSPAQAAPTSRSAWAACRPAARPTSGSGCSATVRPVSEVAASERRPPGHRGAASRRTGHRRRRGAGAWSRMLAQASARPAGVRRRAGRAAPGASGQHVEQHLLDLIEAHRSTIVFANSRGSRERPCTAEPSSPGSAAPARSAPIPRPAPGRFVDHARLDGVPPGGYRREPGNRRYWRSRAGDRPGAGDGLGDPATGAGRPGRRLSLSTAGAAMMARRRARAGARSPRWCGRIMVGVQGGAGADRGGAEVGRLPAVVATPAWSWASTWARWTRWPCRRCRAGPAAAADGRAPGGGVQGRDLPAHAATWSRDGGG